MKITRLNSIFSYFIIFPASVFVFILLYEACNTKSRQQSPRQIGEATEQMAIFNNLIKVSAGNIDKSILSDSLAFLILPVQASCPSCRKKTIDSILKYESGLSSRHFIIISANAGRKTISSYFREQGAELPQMGNQLILDSTGKASEYNLYDDKPTMYYTYDGKAYKMVEAIPATVREDLREFFSGYRNDIN